MKNLLFVLLILTGCSTTGIRYDDTPSLPGGYYVYCQQYPERIECGGTKNVE